MAMIQASSANAADFFNSLLGDSLGASDPVRGLTPRRLAPLGQGKILPVLEGDRIEEDGQIFDPPSKDIVSLHLVPSP